MFNDKFNDAWNDEAIENEWEAYDWAFDVTNQNDHDYDYMDYEG
jgi:hypothetical protein